MIRSTRGRPVSGTEKRWMKVFRTLNEFQARLFAADKALDLGRGGISRLAELTRLGHPITWVTVARCLDDMGYSLQANRQTKEGPQHANRDAQFRYINRQVKALIAAGDPMISVDAKKKERVGPFKNAGRTWRPKGKPRVVNTKDFPSLAQGKALPYGVYDSGKNRAVVNVGVTHDPAELAVESIRRWWKLDGRKTYPEARRLLICADAGGSNGNRLPLWKLNLQQMADQIQIPITVCHYPPLPTNFNKVHHLPFPFFH